MTTVTDTTITPRPSTHRPLTKSYAIDQVTDIEHLRTVAHRMWEAFYAAHSQASHIYGVLTGDIDCTPCHETFTSDRDEPCERYRQWQRKVHDGFGSV